MDDTEVLPGSLLSASPSGALIASIVDGKLRFRAVQVPELSNDATIRSPPKEVTALRWSADNTRILVTSHNLIELIDLDDHGSRMRISNGSGSLGRFQSAEFVGDTNILVIWEFGRAKIYSLGGKLNFTTDLKTQTGTRAWALKPNSGKASSPLALLSQSNAQDQLSLQMPLSGESLMSTSLDTTDAQSLSWSPDGNWLAVLDTGYARPSVVIFTQSGHRFREYPSIADSKDEFVGLLVRAIMWSPDSITLAVSRYDGSVILLNTRTFSSHAIIEHSTTIEQPGVDAADQAIIWQEVVFSTNMRSYNRVAQPASPPLSRVKTSNEPSELGVAEARFSSDGKYLATRDERMLSTVWIWDVVTLCAYAVIIQHSNVRRMHWHPSIPNLLLLDCAESIAYLFDPSSLQTPTAMQVEMPATPSFSFVPLVDSSDKPTILASTKSSFRLIYPHGRKPMKRPVLSGSNVSDTGANHTPADGANRDSDEDDSLIEALTCRKSASQQSYTEQVEVAADADGITVELDDTFGQHRGMQTRSGASHADVSEESDAFIQLGNSEGLDDTFHGKSGNRDRAKTQASEHDPLDDSDIF
ncbi:hypothetical protein B0A48_10040 [Cryoendolithus antarcticus]|uniref:Uncharacterized protein n=1 Tax=Cryoendolithus antarcticus TaxID=1507870 RepID=A0A1V8T3R6_9PEZI|nr:hypothetical protein B0A48_10040 [Cryoendolithus antarcticus]